MNAQQRRDSLKDTHSRAAFSYLGPKGIRGIIHKGCGGLMVRRPSYKRGVDSILFCLGCCYSEPWDGHRVIEVNGAERPAPRRADKTEG